MRRVRLKMRRPRKLIVSLLLALQRERVLELGLWELLLVLIFQFLEVANYQLSEELHVRDEGKKGDIQMESP